MNVQIDRADLVNMIKGSTPSWEAMDNPLVKRCGYFCGGFVDEWQWTLRIDSPLTDDELLEVYNTCKKHPL